MTTMLAIARWYTGVDQTTPFEGGASGSGGNIGYSSPLPYPTVTKSTSGALILVDWGGKVAPGSASANFNPLSPSGYTMTSQSPFASPNGGLASMQDGFETSASAPGTYSGIASQTPGPISARQVQDYATRISCLRPSSVGTAPVVKTSNVQQGTDTVTLVLAGTGSQPIVRVGIHLDDPAAVVTPPDGTWVQSFRQTHTNGALVGYYKLGVQPGSGAGSSYTFTASTSAVPTVDSAAVVSAAHTPAHVGDTLTVDTNTAYSAPGGDPITLYERKPQILDPVTGWGDVSGVIYTSATQGGLSSWTITSAADGKSVRYASRAQNGTGWSDPSYSNALTVLDAPVVATAPAIVTDGTPQDGETVSVDVSPTARATRYTGALIDSYQTKWQDDTGGSYADLSGTSGTSTLLLTGGQVGHHVRFAERAHNGSDSGYSAWNYSDPITVAAHPPITVDDVVFRYSGGTGNSDGSLSIGGAPGAVYDTSTTDVATLIDDLFGTVIGSVATAGGAFYRLIYPENTHAYDDLAGLMAYILTQFNDPDLTLAVGVATQAAGVDVPAVASGTTAPASVTFTTATTPGGGRPMGTLTKAGGSGPRRGLWLRLAVAAGSDRLDTPGSTAAFAIEEV